MDSSIFLGFLSDWWAIRAFAVVALLLLIIKLWGFGTRPKEYPPGPPTLPIIGNLHQMPTSDLHLAFDKWGKEYGPIFSLKLGAQDIIVLNSGAGVKDLLDKRSNIYSTRTKTFIREFGDGLMITTRDNDEIWRRQRRMYHVLLNSNVANKYLPYQTLESTQLLFDLLQNPDMVSLHLKRFTTSLGSTIAYGWRTTSIELPPVKAMFHWIEGWSAIGTKSMVTEIFPILQPIIRMLPRRLSGFKQEVGRLIDLERKLWISLLDTAKLRIKEGKANHWHAWAGASDTTLNTLLAFVKAMILNPEVQAEAQRELDRIVGVDRMPTWEDRPNLPYVRSCVKETLRWLPTALTGVPHATSREDEYLGYKIPERATVFFNTWSINNSVDRPREFDPLRHIDDPSGSQESAVNPDPNKRDHYTFGAGRRICPGIHIADRSLFIAVAKLLWGFRIEPVYDSFGKPLPMNPDKMGPGFVAEPEKYKSKFVPRTDAIKAKILSEWAEASKLLDKEGNYTEGFYKNEFNNHGE